MPSDFDQILNDRLKGYEADFNPADWQQIETMLPEKSHKPYALIALLLLLFGVGGLLVGTGEFHKESSTLVIMPNNSSNDSERNTVAEFKNENTISAIENESSLNSQIENSGAREQNQVVGLSEKTKNEFAEESENVQATSQKGEARIEIATKKKNISDEMNSPISNDSKKSSSRNKISNSNTFEANFQQSYLSSTENTNGNSTAIQNNTETISALASIESGFINLYGQKKMFAAKNALSDDAIPKQKLKKQIVTFALGGGAGMNFSFIDAARWTKPGYIVDISQEIMFINRIGISLTQGYSERKYDGGPYPCPSGTIDCPNSYNSSVRSVDFAADLKANLIHKAKWNWYVKTGIVNTVKLKEEFSYNYPQTDTITPPTLPPQTNFNSGSNFSTNESMYDPSLGVDAGNYPPDLTISGIKRYHIAFHSATGFDVALNSKLKLQLEAGHSFTRPTVGADNQRLHSIGVNGRLFYCFSR